jgi:signal transduction histidine kinase
MSSNDAVNILIVDDLPHKLLALETILEPLGQNLIRAQSGREALRCLLEQDFAVILLDVNMPDMDGLETAALIRQHKRCANTPIIFITAYADEILAAKGYSLGAVDYIFSPIVPEILCAKVRVFVDLFKKTEQVKRHVEERVALAREQTARAAAEQANRRKDQFLAVLSHELRNPLAPIRNALQILSLSRLRDPVLLEARDVLDRQVAQLARIVDDLLDVFRISHSKIDLRIESLDLAELVRLTVEDNRSSLEGDSRIVVLEMPDEPVVVSADRARLAQVLSNLLQNAGKFTNRGDQIGVRVAIDAERQRAVVTVSDTGVGIAPEVLPYVFDTFTQADQGMDRKRGGLGLGLALVKALVELQGGEVHASSPGVGNGAELSFWLPLTAKAVPTPKPSNHLVGSTRQLRILVVEDNQDTAKTMQTLLTRYGHEVRTAHSGPAGIAAARDWQPEVVLCDLGLPEMDGYEVAGALRNDPATSWVRLIAVTGYGQEDDRRRSERAGFDLHLVKPVDPAELQRLLAILKVGP